ncbi:DNA-binding transcriptional ArsR family regulator [Variovorax paradoxus]|jgi:DNA-binding transcriptional ArsR family regulator|uniref:ArsR/SmtB family transcription factor n=1 Tax=Variovorax paradoxus TaxID=34073 RepID=UPI00278D4BE6|nr:helix-turn-helix transcriptional regulator [Variovorax paradoxus]MDQ0569946.1 DNA-binding transcriptional ArsR family regulator [Variovorax paradoxus]
MNDASRIPHVASLLADPARAAIVWTLIDGTTRPAGELAFAANVSAQSASAHLAKLVEGGLLTAEAQGRHRYFRIASAEAAHLIESLASFGASIRPRVPRQASLVRAMPTQFLHARTCYDHLAGEMAVQVLQAMLDAGWLLAQGQEFIATRLGQEKLTALGVDVSHGPKGRRPFARCCVDLTQRRAHLGGFLGAALLDLYVEKGWVLRTARSRVVSITPKGHSAFMRKLGVSG